MTIVSEGINLIEMNEQLRSLVESDPAEEESRKWSALIYILVHHPKCHRLNEIVDCDAKRVNSDDLDRRLSLENWTFAERYLLELALYLFDPEDFRLHLNLSEEIWRLSDSTKEIVANAVGIRLGIRNFEDALLRDLAS